MYIDFKSNYDKEPEIRVDNFDDQAFQGAKAISNELKEALGNKKILTVDCYPGVDDNEILSLLKNTCDFDLIIESKDIFYDKEKLDEMMYRNLTDDRVRGVMYYGVILDFIDQKRLEKAKEELKNCNGRILVYGVAASLISKGDILVYADMARWEIELRYRRGMPNFKAENSNEEFLKKNKRGFFIEWRVADKHKNTLYEEIDYYLDTNVANNPKMVTGKALLAGLKKTATRPFRLVPYFDPGVWGGQWMKEVFALDPSKKNYAWSFDGVPEENSIYLRFGNVRIESPAMNLTKYCPREFLGEKTYSRFGAEFPIRFDLLDTMQGQNLSLQVHPTTEYIKNKFGMTYTQDESYYILDAEENGGVYLGVKTNVDKDKMINELEEAETGKIKFNASEYVNLWPAKKHDHFLIPAGTIHCSSKGCMVLEISATPYIFTFKLWDWDRVDLNGIPRPIHVNDGKQVIQFNRDTQWVKDNLLNKFETIYDGEDFKNEKTGLHELEFIQTNVYTTNDMIKIEENGEFSILNLVGGKEAIVTSPNNLFEPFEIHYAETFILPAKAGSFNISATKDSGEIKVLRANVRF